MQQRYDEHITYLKQFDNIDNVISDYKSVLTFLKEDKSEETKMFLFKTQRIDKLRNENIFETFPELEEIR